MGKRRNTTASTPIAVRSSGYLRQQLPSTPVRICDVDGILSQAEPYVDWDSQSPGTVSRKGDSRLPNVLRTVTNQCPPDGKLSEGSSTSPLVGLFSDSPEHCTNDRVTSTPVVSNFRRKISTKHNQRLQGQRSPAGQGQDGRKRQSPCSSRPVAVTRVTRSSTATSDLLLRMQHIIENPPWKGINDHEVKDTHTDGVSPEKIVCVDTGVPAVPAVVTGDDDLWPDDSLEESDSFVAATQELCQQVEHNACVVSRGATTTTSASVVSNNWHEHVFSKPVRPSPTVQPHNIVQPPMNINVSKPAPVATVTSKPPSTSMITSKPSVATAASKPILSRESVTLDTSLSDVDLIASLVEPSITGQLTSNSSIIGQGKSCNLEASTQLTTEELLDFLSATSTSSPASLPKLSSQNKGAQLIAGNHCPPISKPDTNIQPISKSDTSIQPVSQPDTNIQPISKSDTSIQPISKPDTSTECADSSPAKCSQENIDKKKAEALRRRQRLLLARSGSGEGQGQLPDVIAPTPAPCMVPVVPNNVKGATASTGVVKATSVTSVPKVTGVKTSVPVTGVKTSVPVTGVKTSVPVTGVTASVPVTGVKTSVPVTGVKTSVPVTGVKTSVPVTGVKTSVPVTGVIASVPVTGVKAVVPVTGAPLTGVPVSGVPASVPVTGVSVTCVQAGVPMTGVKTGMAVPGVSVTGVPVPRVVVQCSQEEIERKRQEALRKKTTRLRKLPLPGLS